MESIEQKLRRIYKDIIAKEKIEIHLKNIDRLILIKEERLKLANAQLEKEEHDVARLERESLYNIFRALLGNTEQELEKERQEYLQVYLRKQTVEACLFDLKKEKELLLQNYSSKFNVEAQFDKLLAQQIAILKKTKPKEAKDIIHFESRIANHQAKIREIRQATREGKKTIKVLQSILLSLESVDLWGKSLKASVHGRRTRAKDKIQREIKRTDKYLQNFEKELFDLSDHYGHDYTQQIEEIHNFIDQLVDSLITDWVVRKKIAHSANLVSNLIDKITRIIRMLEMEVEKTREYVNVERADLRDAVVRGKE